MGEKGKDRKREREAGSRHSSPAAGGKNREQPHPPDTRAVLQRARIEVTSTPKLLQLQRLLGNRTTTRFLADGFPPPGESARRIARARGSGRPLEVAMQKQMDAFEREADAFARRPWPLSSAGSAGRERPRAGGENRLGRPVGDPGIVQREWEPGAVRDLLGEKAPGVRAELVAGKYAIHKYDEMRYLRKVGDTEEEGSPLGYHCKIHKWIGISAEEDAGGAAATIVHEVQHARQAGEERWAKLEPVARMIGKEIEAHTREEEFRKARDLPPKRPEYRGASGDVDREAIERDVRRKYDPKGTVRLYPKGHPKEGEEILGENLKHFHNLASNDREVKIWE